MALTQRDLAIQMIQQLRLLDPGISAEIGTPERKILDTMAQSLADSQIDLVGLQGAFDLDNKFGESLDRFLALFGFSRQKATFATGFVTLSRPTESLADIRIPAGMTVQAPALDDATDASAGDIAFFTTETVILPTGTLEIDVPVRASVAGAAGNVAAGRITEIVGSPIIGITNVVNTLALRNGQDAETDDAFKVRFKNTVFRNLAGTEDQFLALGIATAFTSKVNVVGPQSTYREYIQVPPVDDASSYDPHDTDQDPTTGLQSGFGSVGSYTTALSTIPYAKAIWTNLPVFVSNGKSGVDAIFYRQDVDFRFNTGSPYRQKGDAIRLYLAGVDQDPSSSIVNPNVTFFNIYTGTDATIDAVRPNDLALLEYKYLSKASRNDLSRNITNAVDLYIDGGNDQLSTTITTKPPSSWVFVDDPTSKFHYENYRRIGLSTKRPIIGNILMPLFWQPVMDVPDSITVGTNTYFKDVHYWPVRDVSELRGTVRARNGIEWSMDILGKIAADSDNGPYTGSYITDFPTGTPVQVKDYTFDQNIIDLQASLEGSRQVTTDVLAHQSTLHYYKLDVSVMYTSGVNINDINASISEEVDRFLRSQYFGSVVQLSDLLQVIHNVSGVDNVRWSTDITSGKDLTRVIRCNVDGTPLLNVTTDKFQTGNTTPGRPEIQSIYITGQPTSGTFTLSWNGNTTAAIAYNASASTIQTALTSAPVSAPVTVTEDTRSTTGVTNPIRSFRVAFTTNVARPLITADSAMLRGGSFVYSKDFFLNDDVLAALPTDTYTPTTGTPDTVPGLIIRPRAQNTWDRS